MCAQSSLPIITDMMGNPKKYQGTEGSMTAFRTGGKNSKSRNWSLLPNVTKVLFQSTLTWKQECFKRDNVCEIIYKLYFHVNMLEKLYIQTSF